VTRQLIPPVTSVTVQIYAVMDAYRLVLGYRFFLQWITR